MGRSSVLVADVALGCVAVLSTVLCTAGAVEYGRRAWNGVVDLAGVRETAGRRIHIGPTELLTDAWYRDDTASAQQSQASLLMVVDAACPDCESTLRALGSFVHRRAGTAWNLTIAAVTRTPGVEGVVKTLSAGGTRARVRLIRDPDAFQSASGIVAVPTLVALTPQREVAAVLLGGGSGDELRAFFGAADRFRDGDAATVIRGSTPKALASAVTEPTTPAAGDGSDIDHPVRVGGAVAAPRRIDGHAGGAGQAGRGVDAARIVEVTIDPAGRVARVKVLVDPTGNDRALSDEVQTWRYEPVTVRGRDVWAILTTSVGKP
jgi:hypothetical protein